MCVCVCVCMRERECVCVRDREREITHTHTHKKQIKKSTISPTTNAEASPQIPGKARPATAQQQQQQVLDSLLAQAPLVRTVTALRQARSLLLHRGQLQEAHSLLLHAAALKLGVHSLLLHMAQRQEAHSLPLHMGQRQEVHILLLLLLHTAVAALQREAQMQALALVLRRAKAPLRKAEAARHHRRLEDRMWAAAWRLGVRRGKRHQEGERDMQARRQQQRDRGLLEAGSKAPAAVAGVGGDHGHDGRDARADGGDGGEDGGRALHGEREVAEGRRAPALVLVLALVLEDTQERTALAAAGDPSSCICSGCGQSCRAGSRGTPGSGPASSAARACRSRRCSDCAQSCRTRRTSSDRSGRWTKTPRAARCLCRCICSGQSCRAPCGHSVCRSAGPRTLRAAHLCTRTALC